MEQLNPCWRKDGRDYICDLPELPKAIVITFYKGAISNYYSISVRSWFPFKDAEYEKEYEDYKEAISDAEKVILKFISSFLGATNNNNNVNEPQKVLGNVS